jgi:hypothetical protein
MTLVEMNWHPSERQLRQFGLIALVALPLLGGLWSAGPWVMGTLAAAGVVLAGVGLVFPPALRPVFVGLSLVTMPIGWLVSEVALLVLFYGVFVPIGLVLRAAGRDPLERRIDPESRSYWQPKQAPTDVASYFRRW